MVYGSQFIKLCLGLVKIVMPYVGISIKVFSANCQELRNFEKKIDVLSHFKEKLANIVGPGVRRDSLMFLSPKG